MNVSSEEPSRYESFTTLQQLIRKIRPRCRRCGDRLDLFEAGQILNDLVRDALLEGKKLSIRGVCVIRLWHIQGHWQPTTFVGATKQGDYGHTIHKPFWNPGSVRVVAKAKQSLRWALWRLRPESLTPELSPGGPVYRNRKTPQKKS